MIGRSACRRSWPALVAFVDRREHGPETPAALDHLDRCPSCRAEIERVALAIAALARLGKETRRVDPPPGAWARLRRRLARPNEGAWRARSAIAGLAVAVGLVAGLIGPSTAFERHIITAQELGTDPALIARKDARIRSAHRAIEVAYARDRAIVAPATARATGSLPRVYPDNWRPPAEARTARSDSSGRPETEEVSTEESRVATPS
ncbi:MAG TPA: hypothetical protein VNJ28_01490 [Candidatus Limnocylindrales bacterium]|jgi:hypothetical protein|nr:hypothetical protein [Candidatus Limnocylindrales bacterium]